MNRRKVVCMKHRNLGLVMKLSREKAYCSQNSFFECSKTFVTLNNTKLRKWVAWRNSCLMNQPAKWSPVRDICTWNLRSSHYIKYFMNVCIFSALQRLTLVKSKNTNRALIGMTRGYGTWSKVGMRMLKNSSGCWPCVIPSWRKRKRVRITNTQPRKQQSKWDKWSVKWEIWQSDRLKIFCSWRNIGVSGSVSWWERLGVSRKKFWLCFQNPNSQDRNNRSVRKGGGLRVTVYTWLQ